MIKILWSVYRLAGSASLLVIRLRGIPTLSDRNRPRSHQEARHSAAAESITDLPLIEMPCNRSPGSGPLPLPERTSRPPAQFPHPGGYNLNNMYKALQPIPHPTPVPDFLGFRGVATCSGPMYTIKELSLPLHREVSPVPARSHEHFSVYSILMVWRNQFFQLNHSAKPGGPCHVNLVSVQFSASTW